MTYECAVEIRNPKTRVHAFIPIETEHNCSEQAEEEARKLIPEGWEYVGAHNRAFLALLRRIERLEHELAVMGEAYGKLVRRPRT